MKLGVFTPLFNHLTFEEMITEVAEKDCRQLRSVQEVLQAMPTWISISCLLVKQTGKNI